MSKGLFLIFYIMNPFIALLSAIRKINSTSLPYVLMLFCAFYGTTQFTGLGDEKYKDASVYKNNFYGMHDKSISWDNFKGSLLDGETTFDIAIPVISYIIASFTRNEKVLFLVFGLIFGFFYGKNIQFILRNSTSVGINRFLLFLILVFALVIPFWSGLNGLRMWIGAHIFFYGAINILSSSSKNFWWFILLSVLFHFSLITVTALFVLFIFTPIQKFTTIFFILFVVSFVVAESNVGNIVGFVREYTPAIYQAKTEEYTKDIYVETFKDAKQNYSWHAKIYSKALKYSMFYLTILAFVYIQKNVILLDKQKLYLSFALLLFAFSNVISQLPSGGRFYAIAYLFALISISYIYSLSQKKVWFHLAFFPLLFWMVVNIRDGFDHLTPATLVSNPLLTWFNFLDQAPLIDYIK